MGEMTISKNGGLSYGPEMRLSDSSFLSRPGGVARYRDYIFCLSVCLSVCVMSGKC